MKTLHILRSEPAPMTKLLMEATSAKGNDEPFPLYQGPVDYDRLVEKIFSNDRVICWW